MIDLDSFLISLNNISPSADWPPLLIALWYDGKGDWDTAHKIADNISGQMGDWIHAYLHRKEGDQWNANYWYQRAGKQMPNISLEEEWAHLVKTLLEAI